MKKVKLGDNVKDSVSGFEGVIVSEHTYLHGCVRMTLQPKVDKDGKLPSTGTFDLPQLKIVKKEVIKKGNTKVGGPSKYEDTSR